MTTKMSIKMISSSWSQCCMSCEKMFKSPYPGEVLCGECVEKINQRTDQKNKNKNYNRL